MAAGLHIMGSRTYQDLAAYWPSSTEPFAAPMNDIPKVVFSRRGHLEPPGEESTTQAFKDAARINLPGNSISSNEKNLLEAQWVNSKVAGGDLTEEINSLKQQPGKAILAHGGSRFAQSLVKLGLIDEYRLLIHPVVLGNGLPLFSALNKPVDLNLISSLKFNSGIIANVYHPV
jgi:dihydrofolate reductase